MGANPKGHSFSRLNTFTECERKAAFDALSEWKDSPAMAQGTDVHNGLEMAVNFMIEGASAEDAIAQVKEDDPHRILLERDARDDYLDRALPVLSVLRPTSAERWFRRDSRIAPARGKIDVESSVTPVFGATGLPTGEVIEEPCVLDWKTTKSPRNIKSEWEARRALQLQMYCLEAGVQRASFVYLLPSPAPVRGVAVAFTDEQLDTCERWLREQMKVVDSRWEEALLDDGRYDLSGFALSSPANALCSAKWCPYWDKCLGRTEGPDPIAEKE